MLNYRTIGIVVILFVFTFCVQSMVFGEILFQDNFDSQEDWALSPGINDASPGGAMIVCDYGDDCTASPPPAGWTYYRSTGLWFPPTYKPTMEITGDQHRGSTGKSFVVWNESNKGASGDGWGNDGILMKALGGEYQELYIQMYIKTQANFISDAADSTDGDTGDMQVKVVRAAHFDNSGSAFLYFSGGDSAPIMVWDFKHSATYGIRELPSFRGDPQETVYAAIQERDILWTGNSSTDEPNDAGQFADNTWHKYTFRLKMNTYSGGTWNEDGIYQIWYDDTLIRSITDVKWKSAGSSESIGWNVVAIGGNNYNTYDDGKSYGEQWYAIDDLVISTSPIGPADDPIPGIPPNVIIE